LYYGFAMDDPQDETRESRRRARKDRLIQTRVPRDLETTLKAEAKRQRRTVSHLIRGVLEDTFQLVDGVVADVDQLVTDGVELAKEVGRSARRLTDGERAEPEREEPHDEDESEDDDLSHVYAWNEVVLHRATQCSQCESEIPRGQKGFAGLSDRPHAPRAWLCPDCVKSL
jgi:hypothetical protein